jgi:hypothetical protein
VCSFRYFGFFSFFAWWPVVLDKNHLIILTFAFGTFLVGIYIWKMRAVEYEFTGDEIIERRAGRIKSQIRIVDIIETKVKISPHELFIKTNNAKMTVQILPSLHEVIQKKGAEEMAKKSEAEQQHFEEVKQEMTSRIKRTNIIVAVVFMLFAFAIALFVGWFKRKH